MVGGDTIKVSWKKTEDVEEGSSSGKKRKRKEEEEIEAEFRLVVEELWGRIVRRWEELERWQEQRWATMTAILEHIVDNVQDLLDGMVPEEKEKGKEIGVETDAEEMETEEMGEAEEAEESGEMVAGMEKDGDGEMEVEEMLKETEKSFTGWKFYRQSYRLSDNRIRCPIKQLQLDRVYRIYGEFIILNKAGIHIAVGGTRVNKCRNAERRVGNKRRGQGNMERVGIGKSGCIELDNLQKGSTQSSGCAEGWGLLSLSLNPRILWFLCLWLGWLGLRL